MRILREEYHEAAAAYGQLYGLALIEVYITFGAGFDLFFHGAQRCDADELFAVNEVLEVNILFVRLGAVVHGLGLVTLEQGIHLIAVDLHTFGIVFAQIGACKKIKRLCEICADRAV